MSEINNNNNAEKSMQNITNCLTENKEFKEYIKKYMK